MNDDILFVLEEDRILVVVEAEDTIEVPVHIRVIEVQEDGSAR